MKASPKVSNRKLVAVVTNDGRGFWVKHSRGGCQFINEFGVAMLEDTNPLSEVLSKDPRFVGIYEGESITLEF